MKDFDWTSFTERIAIRRKMEDLYNGWTIPMEIEKWFLRSGDFFRNGNKIDPSSSVEDGDEYKWRWYLYEMTEEGKVVEANGKDHLLFTFAGDCLVDIKFYTEADHTIVELRQYNIPTDDNSKKNIRLGCNSGWSFYLLNLKAFYEHGVDLRNKDERFKPMVNN